MRLALGIAGALLMLLGGIWFFQGVGVLPGSFMSGQIRWAVIGGIGVIAGLILVITAAKRPKKHPV